MEDAIRARGSGEVPSHEVGLAILGPLRELDEVAYLRFASVYRGFESLADFEAGDLRAAVEHDGEWRGEHEDAAAPPEPADAGRAGAQPRRTGTARIAR